MNGAVYYSTVYGLCRLDQTVGDVTAIRLSEHTQIVTHDHVAEIAVLRDVLGERSQLEPSEPYTSYPTFGAYKDGTFRQWVGRKFTVHGYRSNYFVLCEVGWKKIDLSPAEKQQLVYNEVDSAVMSLSLSSNSPFRTAPWLEIIQHGKDRGSVSYAELGLEGASEHTLKPGPESPLQLSAASIKNVTDAFAALRSHRTSGAYIACRRWMRSRSNRYIEDSIVDLCIALEALYLDGSGEINFRLAQRCALHVAGSHEERGKVRSLIKDIYKIRSKIVHGSLGYTTKSELDKSNDIRDKAGKLYEILRLALSKRLVSLSNLSDPKFFEHLDDVALGKPT